MKEDKAPIAGGRIFLRKPLIEAESELSVQLA